MLFRVSMRLLQGHVSEALWAITNSLMRSSAMLAARHSGIPSSTNSLMLSAAMPTARNSEMLSSATQAARNSVMPSSTNPPMLSSAVPSARNSEMSFRSYTFTVNALGRFDHGMTAHYVA